MSLDERIAKINECSKKSEMITEEKSTKNI